LPYKRNKQYGVCNKTPYFWNYSPASVEDLVQFTGQDKAIFTGWCMAHTGMTAAATMSLCRVQASRQEIDCHDAITSALHYLLRQQRENGAWQAY
jgi:hypothetical protein